MQSCSDTAHCRPTAAPAQVGRAQQVVQHQAYQGSAGQHARQGETEIDSVNFSAQFVMACSSLSCTSDTLCLQIFTLYSIKINIAVKESGGNNNPETNSILKKLIDEALAQNVPKSTIEKIVKNSKANLDESSEYIYEVLGPGRCGVLVECVAKNYKVLPVKLHPIMKKVGATQERGVLGMFEKKGVILTDAKTGLTEDDAESIAIEVGAEEVTMVESGDKEGS